jgi:signal transduction histidine kinase
VTVHELPLLMARHQGSAPEEIYWTFTYQARRDAHGAIDGVRVFAHDVTEQVQLRQERETQRQQLHDLFMQAPAAICILDGPDLVFEFVNPQYQTMFGGRDLLGKSVLAGLPELASHQAYRTLRHVLDTGELNEELGILVPIVRPDDGALEERYFNYIQQARRNAHGQPDGVLVFAFEVTEQVRARQQAQALAAELTTANQQLTRTNVDLDNFIYTASHDLKVPIANIEGLLLTLRHELPPAALVGDVPEMLQLMQQATERFRRTIDQLTDVSKLQQAYDQPATLVPLAAVVEEVRLDLLPLLQHPGARLSVDVPADTCVPLSEKNLRSVVYNLLSNALKYRHPDRAPDVQLTYLRHDQHPLLRVQDNGLGLDLTQGTDKLFGMFQRLHTHVEGSGIGLYMVKKVVDNSGGRIEVASQLGEGTTFTVFFPVHPGA